MVTFFDILLDIFKYIYFKRLDVCRYNFKFYITVGDRDPFSSPLYMEKENVRK